ncbi:MAG: glycoside hydrolase family 42, partial [Caldilineae bacterium]
MIVDGEPFLVLGGELHNSSASSLAYMQPIWDRLTALHINTVLAVVAWEQLEPEEGRFDFSLVDGLINEARRHGLRLILLWFGTWKNGMSSYAPGWVKRDGKRFPKVVVQGGEPVEILSTFGSETLAADARAFGRLMAHLRQVDGEQHTVLMVQVQNEVGVLGDSRDRSPAAEAAFIAPVPPELVEQLTLHKDELGSGLRGLWEAQGFPTGGSWEEMFGSGVETDELFMAWHYARYLDQVAAAGKAEYPLPLFANAWLSSLGDEPGGWASGGQKPGEWPSGGPLPQTLDIWMAAAPHLDFFAPDIYQPQFAEWCQQYTRRGNPLFIPEMRRNEDGARQLFYALGEHDAMCVSPFGIDSVEPAPDNPLVRSFRLLRQMAPEILNHQGDGSMIGFLLDEETPLITR